MKYHTTNRRGMLLLVVLLMLAMFLAIGTMLLTITARARAAARSSAAADSSDSYGVVLAQDALDRALMAVLRGNPASSTGAVTTSAATILVAGSAMGATTPVTASSYPLENLLDDKYGLPLWATGTITGTGTLRNQAAFGPIGNMSLIGTGLGVNKALNGRLLTFRPSATNNGDVISQRIVSSFITSTSAISCFTAQLSGTAPVVFPSGTTNLDVIINGQEFATEAYDAYDNNNRFLAQPIVLGGTFAGSFARCSYATVASGSATVDNDNDGINDGIWISGTNPIGTLSGTVSLPTTTVGAFQPAFPFISGTVLPNQPSPLGGTIRFDVSYLIVDLDGRLNLNTAGTPQATGTTYPTVVGGTTPPLRLSPGLGYGPADVSPASIFPPLPSASGTLPLPLPPSWPIILAGGTPSTLTTPTPEQRRVPPRLGRIDGRYGWSLTGTAVPGMAGDDVNDLAQMTSASGSTAMYALTLSGNSPTDLKALLKVYMTGSATSQTLNFSLPAGVSGSDWIDDPYEVRLDADVPRAGVPRRSGTSSHSAGLYEPDSPFTLAELERVLRPNDVDASQMPPRLAAALGDRAQAMRMQITTDSWDSPALSGAAAQQVGFWLSGSAAGIRTGTAAWYAAADPISPETAAGLRFNLNRPLIGGTTAQAAYCKGLFTLARILSPTFDSPTFQRVAQWAVNAVDFRDTDSTMTRFDYPLSLASGWLTTTGTGTVWGVERPDLIILSATNTVSGTSVELRLFAPYRALITTGATITGTTEQVHSSLSVGGANSVALTGTAAGTSAIWQIRSGTHVISGTSLAVAAVAAGSVSPTITVPRDTASGTISLERLANPSLAASGSNPYIAVDRKTTPWNSSAPPWIHWPNRPFISQGELLLVHSGSLAADNSVQSIAIDIPAILDATYVPSRFAGNTVSSTSSLLAFVGFTELGWNHFPKYREPGKINVNTIPPNTPAATVTSTNGIWQALAGGVYATTPNPSFNAAAPATSMGQLLLSSTASSPLGAGSATNQFFDRALAIRLANTATIRSHVFAIWVTVRMTDDSPGAPPPLTKRLFAIFDRSIPVGYSPGLDLNVRNAVRVKRFLD